MSEQTNNTQVEATEVITTEPKVGFMKRVTNNFRTHKKTYLVAGLATLGALTTVVALSYSKDDKQQVIEGDFTEVENTFNEVTEPIVDAVADTVESVAKVEE